MIKHGGDSVEPEPVKSIDGDPHLEVGEEEAENLPLGVVEEAGVPQGMVSTRAGVEETSIYEELKNNPLNWLALTNYLSLLYLPVPSNILSPSRTFFEACE